MWDVLVIGGGPAGSAAALSLHERGARVLLLERTRTRSAHPGESLLASGLACLSELGVGDAFRELEARPSYLHRIHWAGRTVERPALWTRAGPTHHLDRQAFDDMLLAECEKRSIDVRRGASVTRLRCAQGRVFADMQSEGVTQATECAGLIDATGRAAWACRRLAARRERADRLVAFVASFERGDSEPSTLIESSADGWWYCAPQPRGWMTAMYVTELLDRQASNVRTLWNDALERAPATRARVSNRVQRSSVRAYRAGPEWTHFDPDLPVVPVGDGALSFDPMAGKGLAFALRSGIEAAEAVGSASGRRAYRDKARGIYESHLRDRETGYALERPLRDSRFWSAPRDRSSPPSPPFCDLPPR